MAGIAVALALLLARGAWAQSPAPYMGDEPTATSSATAPTASTDTAVAPASTDTAVAPASTDTVVGHGAHIAGGMATPARPIRAVIHKSAARWTPVSLRAAGDPAAARTSVLLHIHGAGRRRRGTASRARASARLHRMKDDRRLIVSIFPRALEKKRKHFEVRLRLVEGYVEEAKAVLVTVVDRRPRVGIGLDSQELTRAAVEFEEEFPDAGEIRVAALDPRPSSKAFNAGLLRGASFADRDAGLADVSWSVRGLPKAR